METPCIRRWQYVLAAAVVLGLKSGVFAADNVDATITVTPVATVSLSINPTTYAFGNRGIGSQTVTSSSLTLTNNGQVNVSVDKRIATDPADWTAGTTPAQDVYALYVATST